MTVGALLAGLMVALVAGVVSRSTVLHEDASLAAFYLISLALSVLVISLKGSRRSTIRNRGSQFGSATLPTSTLQTLWTLLGEQVIPDEVADRVLNHARPGVGNQHYNHAKMLPSGPRRAGALGCTCRSGA